MKRRSADVVAALVVVAILAFGLLLTWNAYNRQQQFSGTMGGMMGSSGMMGTTSMAYGTSPSVYLFGALLVAVLLVGGYLYLRSDLLAAMGADGMAVESRSGGATPESETGTNAAGSETGATDRTVDEPARVEANGSVPAEEASVTPSGRPAVLDVLPEDERRVLEPVIESPGLTQIALRDRSDFSKSKVSQTVSDLEKRGLLYRERQGRTYRVYPSDDLVERTAE